MARHSPDSYDSEQNDHREHRLEIDSERERLYSAIDHRRDQQKEAALERSAMVGGRRLLTVTIDLNEIGPAIASAIRGALRNRGLSLSADVLAELGNNVAQVVVSCEVDQ